MNRIEKMIADLCPNGVEWKELGEVCEIKKGKQLNKTLLTLDGKYPAYNGGKTFSGRTDEYNVSENTIIVSQGGASAGFVNFVETKFWANAHCYFLLPDLKKIENRYVYHYLKMKQSYLMDFQHGAGIPALSSEKLNKLKMPVPPLEIQEEIVKVLDTMSEHVTELQSELQLRTKQYEYFREDLLTFEEHKVEWKTLGEVCTINQGLQVPLSERELVKTENNYFYITVQFLKNQSGENYYIKNPPENTICRKEDILVTRTGSTGRIITGVEGCFHNNFFKVNITEKLNSKYLYYYLDSPKLYDKMLQVASGGTVPDLTHKAFYKLPIPVPSLEIQEKIVYVLDNFDKVCNDLNIGLPKEIELRQKEYEYYREKLLTFDVKYSKPTLADTKIY